MFSWYNTYRASVQGQRQNLPRSSLREHNLNKQYGGKRNYQIKQNFKKSHNLSLLEDFSVALAKIFQLEQVSYIIFSCTYIGSLLNENTHASFFKFLCETQKHLLYAMVLIKNEVRLVFFRSSSFVFNLHILGHDSLKYDALYVQLLKVCIYMPCPFRSCSMFLFLLFVFG